MLGESATLDEALPRCLDALGDGLGARRGAALAAGRGQPRAALRGRLAGSERLRRFADESRALGLERRVELPGRVWAAASRPRSTTWRRATGRARSAAAADGLHGALAVPIASEREVHGVFELVRGEPGGFDPDAEALAASIGLSVGQYVERKRAERAVIENAENIAAVLEATRELARSASATRRARRSATRR